MNVHVSNSGKLAYMQFNRVVYEYFITTDFIIKIINHKHVSTEILKKCKIERNHSAVPFI